MDKFIKVTKGDEYERQKSHEWRNTCKALQIPYIVVLIDGEKIGIGASIIHLIDIAGQRLAADTAEIEKQLRVLYSNYVNNIKGYWNFNDLYHLLDFVPEAQSLELADKVYDILSRNISFKAKN